MQFGDNYLNDGHLPPEIPKQTAATASIPCHVGRSRCPLKCQTGRPPTSWSFATAASCVAVVTSRVTCVWQARRQHQTTVVALIIAMPACDSTRRTAPTATAVCGSNVWTADASACGRRSARIVEIRRRLAPENSRTRTDADHLLKLGTRQADLLSTVSRCYSIVVTDVFDLSHPVTMLRSCSR